METENSMFICIATFCVVVVPYLFVSFFISKPKTGKVDFFGRNIPSLYKMMWGVLEMFAESLGAAAERIFPGEASKYGKLLKIASIRMDVRYVFAAQAFLAVLMFVSGALLFMLFTQKGWIVLLMALMLMLAGYVLPKAKIASAADLRQTAVMKALPFAIDLIGSAMRSGVDFTAAIRYYVATEERSAPLAQEFSTMLRELELGKTRIEAIEAMSERIQTDAFTSFAAAVTHGIEVGASIVETMKIQGEEMRRVRFNIAERKAARAASAMILPIAIFIMPAFFIVLGIPVYIKVCASGLGGIM